MNEFNTLYKHLNRLDTRQFKIFYGILIHYWYNQKAFLCRQNFFNLWCELNGLCHEANEGFPDINDHELVKSYCQAHPYYFIDILDLETIIKLFCEHLDNRIDILAAMAQKLDAEGIRAAYECVNKALGLDENIDELAAEAEAHVREFS